MTGDDDVRAARRREQLTAIHDRLVDAVEQLANGDAWQHMLQVAARMPHYSLNNILLVTVQRPDATAVAGYRAWAALGRQVRKGEKGIAILAPCLYRPEADADAGDERAEPSRVLRGFRVVHVFDISQTDGPDLPAPPQQLEGQAPAGLWRSLAALVTNDGFTLERGPCGRANGYTDYSRRVVRVRHDVDEAQAVKTLAHELGHIRADHEHRYIQDYRTSSRCRGLAEIEAESIAFIVLAAVGADPASYSVPYVTGWSGGSKDVLKATAMRVVALAAEITDVVLPRNESAVGAADPWAHGPANALYRRGRASVIFATRGSRNEDSA